MLEKNVFFFKINHIEIILQTVGGLLDQRRVVFLQRKIPDTVLRLIYNELFYKEHACSTNIHLKMDFALGQQFSTIKDKCHRRKKGK